MSRAMRLECLESRIVPLDDYVVPITRRLSGSLRVLQHANVSDLFSAALGAAYGTAKAGTGIAAMSVMRPELIMKSIIPVVMAGIIAIYGLVVAVLIAGSLDKSGDYKLFTYVSLGQ